jgi:flagellar protein FlaF
MPIGELIGAAIGIMLLIIVAYVVVGSVLVTTQISTSAERDVAWQNEARLNTQMVIFNKSSDGTNVYLSINNTGSEMISDFSHMYIISSTNCNPEPIFYNFSTSGNNNPGNWNISRIYAGTLPETQHIGMLDPGEQMDIWFPFTACFPSTKVYVTVASGNGATISTSIP